MQDAAAGGHPLRRPVLDRAAAAMGVLVQERPVDDVRDGLEAAMRVPVGSAGFARRVVDLAHLVHVDERVELGEADAGERPAHRESLALGAARCGRHRPHGRSVSVGSGDGMLGTVSGSAVTAGMTTPAEGICVRKYQHRATCGYSQGSDHPLVIVAQTERRDGNAVARRASARAARSSPKSRSAMS